MNGKAAPFNKSKNSRSMRLARCEGVNEGFCAAAAGADCEGFSPCPFSPSALSSSLYCARSEAGLSAAPLAEEASAVSPAGGSSGRFSLSCADCAGALTCARLPCFFCVFALLFLFAERRGEHLRRLLRARARRSRAVLLPFCGRIFFIHLVQSGISPFRI